MNDIPAYIRKCVPKSLRPCNCAAYNYPHRLGSGDCRAERICQHDNDLDEGRCPVCDALDRADEIHDGRY